MTSQRCPITHFSKVAGHRPALVSDTARLTYRDLDRLIDGLKPPFKAGTIVPFISHNQIDDILFLFSLYRHSIIPFPLSFRQPLNQLKSIAQSVISQRDEEAATYILTSGSSANPKIVRLSWNNHIKSAEGVLDFLKIEEDDRLLLTLPLFHIGGLSLLFRTFLAGAALILPGKNWIGTLQKWSPTRLSLVPYQLKQLLNHDLSLTSCRSLLLGGQSLSPALGQIAERKKWPIVTSYGMSEMASMVTGQWLKSDFSMGFPLAHRQLRIDERSEIWVRGETRFLGYVGRASLSTQEWFPTGDLGVMTAPGLEVIGRKDRQFISGGENIYPETIERALLSLGSIWEAHVVPIDDPDYGQRPLAYIHPFCNVDKLSDALAQMLPRYMIPVSFKPLEKASKLSRDL